MAAGVIGMVVAVKKLVFHRRFGGGPWALAACGPGWARHGGGCRGEAGEDGHGHRGWGRWGGFGRGPGRSFWLRGLFARLDTTPGQEREIRAAIEEFQTAARGAKDGLKDARADLARAIGSETFDEVAVAEASARVDGATSHVKDALTAALKRAHGVLDAHQRQRLAELLTNGPGFGRRGWGSPYRD
ncbi:MAG TPA: periplasmic heavy metal sensor [Labilithrix sp.]|nr:periplasmic heavy metal sensor [Labilithrix sp.]